MRDITIFCCNIYYRLAPSRFIFSELSFRDIEKIAIYQLEIILKKNYIICALRNVKQLNYYKKVLLLK